MAGMRGWFIGVIGAGLLGCAPVMTGTPADTTAAAPALSAPADSPPAAAFVPTNTRSLAHYLTARVMAGIGADEASLYEIRRASALEPESLYLRAKLAATLAQTGHYGEARQLLEGLIIFDPGNEEVISLLAWIANEEGRVAETLGYLEQLIILDPEDADRTIHLSLLLARSGIFDRSILLLERYLQRHPETPQGWLALGRIARQGGETERMLAAYRSLLKYGGGQTDVVEEFGTILEDQELINEARELYLAHLKRYPDDRAVRNRLAGILAGTREFVAALAEIDRILAADPSDLDARRKQGLIYMETGRFEEAVPVLQGLVDAFPDADLPRYYLARALDQIGRSQEALPHLAAIGSESGYYWESLVQGASIHYRQGEKTQARALLEQALAFRPQPEATIFYAGLLSEMGEAAAAEAAYSEGIAVTPDHVELRYRKAMFLERQNRGAEARTLVEEVLKIDQEHAESQNYLAYSWAEEGIRLEEALQLVKKALRTERKPHMLDTLGWVYYKLGRYGDARKALLEAEAGLPDDPTILEHLGDLFRVLGEEGKAGDYYRKALDEHPDAEMIRRKLETLR